jgi:sarcosine oxidase
VLRFDRGSEFLYQPEGAIVRAGETLEAQAGLARAAGAELRERTVVEAIRPAGDRVELATTDGEVIQTPVAIVAVGAWAGPLLHGAGIDLPLRPTLEQSTHFDAGDEGSSIPTVIDWDAGPREPPYLVPNPFRPGEIKAGAHLSGPLVDPDTRSFEPDAAREDFVIDRIGPLVVASPCTGHGFKFAPLIGGWLADLAIGEQPSIPLDRFRADRPALHA